MPSTDPLTAAMDAAAKMKDGLIPLIKDRFAKAPAPQPRVSLDRLASLPDADAEALLQPLIDRHGEAAVEAALRKQATVRLRRRGLL